MLIESMLNRGDKPQAEQINIFMTKSLKEQTIIRCKLECNWTVYTPIYTISC